MELPTWDVGMDEGRGMLRWGVDQHRSDTVGTGHLQSLVSRKEKLEKQAARSAAVTPLTGRGWQADCLRARAQFVSECLPHYMASGTTRMVLRESSSRLWKAVCLKNSR